MHLYGQLEEHFFSSVYLSDDGTTNRYNQIIVLTESDLTTITVTYRPSSSIKYCCKPSPKQL